MEREKGLVEQTKSLVSQQLESASKQVAALELELNSCADGEIIGDGRADFTCKTLSYRFDIEQCDFNLLDVPGIEGSYQYIFPSRTDYKKHLSDMALNTMIRRMGYGGRATGHGFRHTMSTILHEQGYNTAWVEIQLAHVDKNSIRGTYNHAQYIDGRREMLQWYADYMDALESGDNVVHGNFKRA